MIVDSFAVENKLHWTSKYFAPIDDMIVLDKPIHINDFRDFITISRTSLSSANERGSEVSTASLSYLHHFSGHDLRLCSEFGKAISSVQ